MRLILPVFLQSHHQVKGLPLRSPDNALGTQAGENMQHPLAFGLHQSSPACDTVASSPNSPA